MFIGKSCSFTILLHIIGGAHVPVSLENNLASYDVQGINILANERDNEILIEGDDAEKDGPEGLDLCVSDPNNLECQSDGSEENIKIQ